MADSSDRSQRERDLVLASNQYAFILDETKGNVVAYVGPHKTSLAGTDRPVTFSPETRKYVRCTLEEAIQEFLVAPEGWYTVLENPCKEGGQEDHPRSGATNPPKLEIGRKIIIPGPITYPLWPGQVGLVVSGHHLRSNQYLIVRVYNEEEARRNWGKSIVKPQRSSPPREDAGASKEKDTEGSSSAPERLGNSSAVAPSVEEVPDLTMGKLFVIKGTDVSFYIPQTGIEVVRDSNNSYIRDAVTLERLEYCILLDEDGEKRYVRGPDVVFPKPTESFIENNGSRKFKAIELNEISGIYVKVIAPYEDRKEDGIGNIGYNVGDELFITGNDMMIYFPRPEHAIIRYGKEEIHYAVAIPAGEGRYVLNRLTGEITTKVGPCTFLPDPRKEVIVRRILSPKAVTLFYPGNAEALKINAKLAEIATQDESSEVAARGLMSAGDQKRLLLQARGAGEAYMPDDFSRKTSHTPPRTITLETKYDGAVAVTVWTGYAVLVTSKTGVRKVVAGPKTVLLNYDETLEAMSLSTGTPKADTNVFETVYLRVIGNKVSDVISAETNDLCGVSIKLSYRVNFEDDSEKWFNVENYVKFLTDHLRSLIRNAVKHHGIENFYRDAISIIRDAILGVAGENGKRPGRQFEENGMRIYDVEVLDVKIGDTTIAGLLVSAQHTAVQQAIKIAQEERGLEITRRSEDIKRQIAQAQVETAINDFTLQIKRAEKALELELSKLSSELTVKKERLASDLAQQEVVGQIQASELLREHAAEVQRLEFRGQELELELAQMKAEVDGFIEKAKAVTPQMISALQTFGDRQLASKVAETMSPLAMLGGESVADVFGRMLKGTVFEKLLSGGNGIETEPVSVKR